ncbi:uncharacterized protein A1O5_06277 [Cladophialophora psammophila CBS 110553]|uniref:Heterokaryon incompatibility domain-containing protein n=1 Tax=Cladophialophora psammophila CBS 110553 TaxID=1182543 RepID=W9XIL9_9EURO|nr:uncharacterized protein A1O5_06277 [Cladophialophora psammophila CBS 110553]EXJ70209.1 hypothetical protein A1O5_06277 [Cladophialophora psammophila CBS 110553]
MLVEVCNIIFWMLNIQVEMGLSPTNYTGWGPRFLQEAITLPVVSKAEQDLSHMDICKTQIWNLIGTSERKECDLPDIVTTLEVLSSIRHPNHHHCTPAMCMVQRLSSTHLKQQCKCFQENCEQLTIVIGPLSNAVRSGTPTAWLLDGTRLTRRDEPYLALSHVWSDGTGDGTKQQGTVNRCLFKYFARIAARLKCTGIWWDTLSLPKDEDVRSEALKSMHTNYAQAECTVVHNDFLLNQEFKNSENACLALVLSPWFTRGWTALELAMSKNVKVLFKGSTSNDPDIRDLSNEILASGPATVSRAHWLATCAIKRIIRINDLTEVIAILSQRYTSWEEDRVKIASLLAGVGEPDFRGTASEITQRLIHHFGRVPYSVVLHDHPTMTEAGGFSWCPPRVDEMPIDVRRDLDLDDDEEGDLTVEPDGSVTGIWLTRPVSIIDIMEKRLQPRSKDPAVIQKIQTALESWGQCLILYQDVQLDRQALLVKTIEVSPGDGVIDCQYVGVIVDAKAEPKHDNTGIANWLDAVMPDGEKELGNRYCPFPIRLGKNFSITGGNRRKEKGDGDDDDSHAWKILNEAQKIRL